MRWFIIFSSMLFMLFGCAAKKLAIRNADTFIVRSVEKRLPLTSKQSEELDRDVDKFLNDTKSQAQVLKDLLDTIDLTKSQRVKADLQSLTSMYLKIVSDFSQILAKHLAELSEVQQSKLFKNLEKDNEDIERKEKKDGQKNFKERFSYFFGSVSPEQEGLAVSLIPHFKQRTLSRLAARRALQVKFESIYTESTDKFVRGPAIHRELVAYQEQRLDNQLPEIVEKFRASLTPEQLKYFEANKQELKELLDYFITVEF